jgi:hypothetical protein
LDVLVHDIIHYRWAETCQGRDKHGYGANDRQGWKRFRGSPNSGADLLGPACASQFTLETIPSHRRHFTRSLESGLDGPLHPGALLDELAAGITLVDVCIEDCLLTVIEFTVQIWIDEPFQFFTADRSH